MNWETYQKNAILNEVTGDSAMTKIKEHAIELLWDIPDEKVVYVIDILKGLKGISDSEINECAAQKNRRTSMGILSKYANADLIPYEKEAWGKAVKEKYADS